MDPFWVHFDPIWGPRTPGGPNSGYSHLTPDPPDPGSGGRDLWIWTSGPRIWTSGPLDLDLRTSGSGPPDLRSGPRDLGSGGRDPRLTPFGPHFGVHLTTPTSPSAPEAPEASGGVLRPLGIWGPGSGLLGVFGPLKRGLFWTHFGSILTPFGDPSGTPRNTPILGVSGPLPGYHPWCPWGCLTPPWDHEGCSREVIFRIPGYWGHGYLPTFGLLAIN